MSLIDLLKSRRSADVQPSAPSAVSAPFQSTRSDARAGAPEAVLRGLAPDGGLYVDPEIASGNFDVQGCLALDPLGQSEKILSRLLPGFGDMPAAARLRRYGAAGTPRL